MNNNNNIRSGPVRSKSPIWAGCTQTGPIRAGWTQTGSNRVDSVRSDLDWPGSRLGVARHRTQAENRVFSVLREHRRWHPRSINGASRVGHWSSTHAMRAVLEKQLRSVCYWHKTCCAVWRNRSWSWAFPWTQSAPLCKLH